MPYFRELTLVLSHQNLSMNTLDLPDPIHLKINTTDNFSLGLTCYSPSTTPTNVIIIGGAMGVKQSFYRHFAAHLTEKGSIVYTFDYRGIGASKNKSLSKYKTKLTDWAKKDLASVIKYASIEHSGLELNYVGHSLGGQLIVLTEQSEKFDKIALIGAQSGYWKLWTGMGRMGMYILWHFIVPFFTLIFGYFPGFLMGSENIPAGVALEWAKWSRTKGYLFSHHKELYNKIELIRARMLSISFSDDKFAPEKAVLTLNARFFNVQLLHYHLTPEEVGVNKIGHLGYFRPHKDDAMWQKLTNWLMGGKYAIKNR
jgi:predicted alpha/beta hydrolase